MDRLQPDEIFSSVHHTFTRRLRVGAVRFSYVYYASVTWSFVGCALCGFGAYPHLGRKRPVRLSLSRSTWHWPFWSVLAELGMGMFGLCTRNN